MKTEPHIYLALVHYPILNNAGDVVTTSVTNLDVHDIARIAKTFECKGFFVVTPVHAQRQMVKRLRRHWDTKGQLLDHPRKAALALVDPVESLQAAANRVYELERAYPTLVATSARPQRRFVSFDEMKALLREGGPVMLVFGTGWGLAEDALSMCNLVLEPIKGVKGYNHLPVRAAVAIILDRLRS